MATFKCLQSGNTVSFTYQHDIDSMKRHEGYVRIDEVETSEKPLASSETKPVKKMGRPRKVENV
jgi:cupin superfamily acireductone dioxygenase involved in methionine salvage